MGNLPKDCSARRIGSEARKLVHYKFSCERWEYREITGQDNGLDCIIELIENDEWTNKKIFGQIKGTLKAKKLTLEDAFSLEIDVKTVLYGLREPNAFVVFYVNVCDETVYYLPLQDYFISRPENFSRIEKNKSRINLHIPCDNIVSEEDFDLQQIAKSLYVGEPLQKLHKIE